MKNSHTEEIRRLLDETLPFLTATTTGKSSSGTEKIPDTKQLLKGLFDLYTLAGEKLETTTPNDFPKMWLLRGLVHELLQYSIEDDYVDISQSRAAIFKAFQALAKEDHWFADSRIESAIDTCRTVATKQPLNDIRVELRLSNDLRVIARLAPAGQPAIQVSSKAYPLVPILEDSITHPEYVKGVVMAYAQHIKEFQTRFGVNALCFVEKDVGPVGALSMVSMLVQEVNLPATIYRTKHWSNRAKIAAYRPTASDRMVIIYDLLVTGDGLQQVAKNLQDRFGAAVPAAVVLFGYETKRYEIPIPGDNGGSLAVHCLGWYDTLLAEEVDNIRQGRVDETAHLVRLVDEAQNASLLRDRTEGIDSTKEEEMSTESNEETLGIIIAGLEDFDRDELSAMVDSLFHGSRGPSKVKGNTSIRILRRCLIEQANLLYHQQPQQLKTVRKAIRAVALQTIERLTNKR